MKVDIKNALFEISTTQVVDPCYHDQINVLYSENPWPGSYYLAKDRIAKAEMTECGWAWGKLGGNLKRWLHFVRESKLCIPSTLNIDLILWHRQYFVCLILRMLNHGLSRSWVISFTFQAYTLTHTLNCICVSLSKFHIWIWKQF